MLLPILGEGNFRIQVSTDVDFSVVEETKELVDPQNVLTQEFVKSDTTLDQLAAGIPGSLANEPPVPNEQGGDENNERTSERSESNRQFENGRSVTHTQFEVGRIKSMSLSVLINEGASLSDEGWTDERLASLGEMVKKQLVTTMFEAINLILLALSLYKKKYSHLVRASNGGKCQNLENMRVIFLAH